MLSVICSDIAFKFFKVVSAEFTNTKLCAILTFSFVKIKSGKETFSEFSSVLEDSTQLPRAAEKRFDDSEPVKRTQWINQPAEDL